MPSKPSTGGDAARRASRTAVQVSIVTGLVAAWSLFAPRPLTTEQTAFIMTTGPVLVSFLQNLLEEQHVLPEMVKRPTAPPPTEDLEDLTAADIRALLAELQNARPVVSRREEPVPFQW